MNNVSFVVDPMLVFEFIHRIIDILTDYLGDVSESSIRENFVTVYQVQIVYIVKRGQIADTLVVTGRNVGLWLSLDN